MMILIIIKILLFSRTFWSGFKTRNMLWCKLCGSFLSLCLCRLVTTRLEYTHKVFIRMIYAINLIFLKFVFIFLTVCLFVCLSDGMLVNVYMCWMVTQVRWNQWQYMWISINHWLSGNTYTYTIIINICLLSYLTLNQLLCLIHF